MNQAALIAPIQTNSRNRHLGYLDSLRGIAILMVLWVHGAIAGGMIGPDMALHRSWPIFFIGQRGVELFYEVSAFTLFLSMSRSRGERAPLRNFFLRRFFRIAPAYYAALLAGFLWVGHNIADRSSYLLGVTFLNGWSPKAINLPVIGSWSVAVEVMFYVCMPFLFQRIRTFRAALFFFLVGWVCTFFPDVLLTRRFPAMGEYFMLLWPVAQLPVFAMGILAFHAYQALTEWRKTAPVLSSERGRKGISTFLLLASAILLRSSLGRGREYVVEASFSFVLLILAGDLYAWPALFNRPLAWLGKISFSLYLFHFFPLYFLQNRISPDSLNHYSLLPHSKVVSSLCAFVALMTVSIPISWLTWRWIEVPGIFIGRDVIRRLEGRATAKTPLPTDVDTSTPGFQF